MGPYAYGGKGGKEHRSGTTKCPRSFSGKGAKEGNSWTRSAAKRVLGHGEFDWASVEALEVEPEIRSVATYSYAHKSASVCDVLCPAWSVRRLRKQPGKQDIDLSLERGLKNLQLDDGGFQLTSSLVAVLGLQEPGGALALAEDPEAEVFGAVLALKAVRWYKRGVPSPVLDSVCADAEHLVCSSLGITPASLRTALDAVGSSLEPPNVIPFAIAEVLRENFAAPGRWSFFALWARLLPTDTMDAVRNEGGILCPRFFLVDMASAPLSPYDADKIYPLMRRGSCIFVGQPPDDGEGNFDAMRQGRQLEATLCSFAWVEEDHVLTEVVLQGVRAIFSAAPDAVAGGDLEGDGVVVEPLLAGDDSSYEAAGYHLDEVFPVASSSFENCRIWRGEWAPTTPESYVEVKKTTHLKGPPGQFKILKFWLQAALMRCGAVMVATTEGSDGDMACNVQKFTLDQLTSMVEASRVWGLMARMLQHVVAETAASDGPWTLRMQKARGPGAPVSLMLAQGWDERCCRDEPSNVWERLADFFNGSSSGEEEVKQRAEPLLVEDIVHFSVGDEVEGYWTDSEMWLPARVTDVLAGGSLTLSWREDGSLSDVPADYARRPCAELQRSNARGHSGTGRHW